MFLNLRPSSSSNSVKVLPALLLIYSFYIIPQSIYIWNCDSYKLIRYLRSPDILTCGFFVAGDGHVVTGTSKGSILIYDIQSCTVTEQLNRIHDGSVVAMAEHPNKTG